MGLPNDYAQKYDREGIDEIIYLDMVASLYQRNALAPLVEQAAASVFTPITVGGGISNVRDGRDLFLSGADKLALNTAIIQRPELITEIAHKFGAQAMVVQIDAKRRDKGWEAYTHGGRQPSGRDAVSWAREAVDRGAGEILVTSIDQEGTGKGFDLELLEHMANSVCVPVLIAGGFGHADHAVEAARAGAAGIAMAGSLHYNKVSLDQIRSDLERASIAVRWPSNAQMDERRATV